MGLNEDIVRFQAKVIKHLRDKSYVDPQEQTVRDLAHAQRTVADDREDYLRSDCELGRIESLNQSIDDVTDSIAHSHGLLINRVIMQDELLYEAINLFSRLRVGNKGIDDIFAGLQKKSDDDDQAHPSDPS